MKQILFLAIILLGLNLNAQTEIKKGSYIFDENIITNQSNMTVKDQKAPIEIIKNSKITVVGQSDDLKKVYIKYWKYTLSEGTDKNPLTLEQNEENAKLKPYNDSVFELPAEIFKKITSPLYSYYKGTTVGVYTVPFRLRGSGNNFDFESSLSLQANIVLGLGTQRMDSSWFDLSLGIGLTGVNLNSDNSLVTESRTASAFTVSGGMVIKPSKFANIGIFVGFDNLSRSDRDVDWVHNGNLWVGLGINVSFNAITTTESAAPGNQD
ncbi:hypothetical protein [Flavobacterium sp. SM2513]|uniref:hypothetical protein n=1 Tax=Flavobacterium sp. SM2513 TaxID=3424766 RepID=UPI003D7FCFB4